MHQLGPVQPHADPHAVRRRRGRVLAPARARHAVGRRGRAPGGDHRTGRGAVHAAAHVPRPLAVRGAAVQVRADHRAERRHRERPDPAPAGARTTSGSRSRTRTRCCTRSGVQAFAGMDVEIREPDVSPLQLQGPKSKDVIRDAVRRRGRRHALLPLLGGRPRRHPASSSRRTGWTGEVGYELYLRDGSRGIELWDRVMAAGEPHEIRAIAPSDQRRLEAGIFNYGNDMGVEDTPFHVTGTRAARGVLRRLHRQGGARAGLGARASTASSSASRSVASRSGCGSRTSGPSATAARSSASSRARRTRSASKKNIGYAWVPIALAEHGTALELGLARRAGARDDAALPFWDPNKDVPKT